MSNLFDEDELCLQNERFLDWLKLTIGPDLSNDELLHGLTEVDTALDEKQNEEVRRSTRQTFSAFEAGRAAAREDTSVTVLRLQERFRRAESVHPEGELLTKLAEAEAATLSLLDLACDKGALSDATPSVASLTTLKQTARRLRIALKAAGIPRDLVRAIEKGEM